MPDFLLFLPLPPSSLWLPMTRYLNTEIFSGDIWLELGRDPWAKGCRGSNGLWKKGNQEIQFLILVLSLTVYVTLGQSLHLSIISTSSSVKRKG